MVAKMSLRKKIGMGFGSILFFLAVIGVISYCGIGALNRDVSDTVQKNELIANLFQREIDHLGWASKVSDLLLSSQAAALQVETDPHKCAFGQWYDSPQRRNAEKEMPALAALLAKIEEPHKQLHTSAIEIDKLYQQKEHEQAKGVFVNKTLPALAEVRGLLKECSQVAKTNVTAVNEGVKQSASFIQNMVTVIAVIAVVLGTVLGYWITRGIARALHVVIERLRQGADSTSDAARQVSSTSQSLAQGASEQAASIEETSASIEEMSSMTKQNAANATEARSLAAQAREYADTGTASMERMSQAIDDIKKSADETAKIIKTIDDIAFQTNLLALNAAVEAARAGEAGKGFAVVAEEVRSLAMRSAEAAKNTADLIQQSVKNSDNGVAISREVADVLENIAAGNRKVNELVDEIAAASEQQSQGIEQVNTTVGELEQVTQSNAANAEESASAAEELSSQSEELNHTVQDLQILVNGGAGSNTAATPSRKTPSRFQTHSSTTPMGRQNRSRFKLAVKPANAPTAEELLPFSDDPKDVAEF